MLTLTALIAFAANSLLCRMALASRAIDPASFTSVRLLAGALALVPLVKLTTPEIALRGSGQWRSGLALFCYAIAFSWAYVSLNTATGALILFASVQVTLIAAGLANGERLAPIAAAGAALAASGLGYLLLPGATAPAPGAALTMVAAGCAWGLYTQWGRGSAQPLATTASNFVRATLPALAVSACCTSSMHIEPRGLALAACSGALTSGLGYAVWYRALRRHSALSAAVVQLSVPVIAAALGVVVIGEHPSQRLAIATLMILGGIAIALLGRARTRPR
jgi:drug/metabolite transporter (DMT)-like permease